ncbi:uncharacterized protein LOC120839800 [Ixodes scapularis]|uniref:uncharacterized protein LOC120839800 n=1 Tax=Ixodes scapularis TaxID=6945 RepID=UPI001C383FDC|nr:uncharacterized protein LOC120839800 [Ixodes scapularis]
MNFNMLVHFSGQKFYGQDTTSDTTPSLLGINAYCVTMEFLRTGVAEVPNTLFLKYIDASDPAKDYTWTKASLDIKVESTVSVTFTFTLTDKKGLMDRTVQYELLNVKNQDSTYCSTLQTSKGQSNCSYWVLVMGGGDVVPEWCQSKPIEQGCKVPP